MSRESGHRVTFRLPQTLLARIRYQSRMDGTASNVVRNALESYCAYLPPSDWIDEADPDSTPTKAGRR